MGKKNLSTPVDNSALRLLGAAKSESIFEHLLKTLSFFGTGFSGQVFNVGKMNASLLQSERMGKSPNTCFARMLESLCGRQGGREPG